MSERSSVLRLLMMAMFLVFGTNNVVAQDEVEGNTEVFEEFAQQDGVIKRASGLLIKIITSGDGGIVGPYSRVVVHYEGRLADGTVFDSSYARGQPITLPVSGVIRGWQEALLLMQIGSKWEIAIPSDIAYGKADQRSIPGNSNLFFTIELLGER